MSVTIQSIIDVKVPGTVAGEYDFNNKARTDSTTCEEMRGTNLHMAGAESLTALIATGATVSATVVWIRCTTAGRTFAVKLNGSVTVTALTEFFARGTFTNVQVTNEHATSEIDLEYVVGVDK